MLFWGSSSSLIDSRCGAGTVPAFLSPSVPSLVIVAMPTAAERARRYCLGIDYVTGATSLNGVADTFTEFFEAFGDPVENLKGHRASGGFDADLGEVLSGAQGRVRYLSKQTAELLFVDLRGHDKVTEVKVAASRCHVLIRFVDSGGDDLARSNGHRHAGPEIHVRPLRDERFQSPPMFHVDIFNSSTPALHLFKGTVIPWSLLGALVVASAIELAKSSDSLSGAVDADCLIPYMTRMTKIRSTIERFAKRSTFTETLNEFMTPDITTAVENKTTAMI